MVGQEEFEYHELPYIVEDWSSFSCHYYPHRVLEESKDQDSRWSSAGTSPEQFLLLKLVKPAILCSITFGKPMKGYLFNLREFKVYVGEKKSHMVQVLHSGLYNDDEAETLPVSRYADQDKQILIPCFYVKVVPIANWKISINYFTICNIKLLGDTNQQLLQNARTTFSKFCEREATRLCLKFLRQRKCKEAFKALLSHEDSTLLEHPLLTELHDKLIEDGDFDAVENILTKSFEENLFSDYIRQCTYSPTWERILTGDTKPGVRGGHQMCIDSEEGMIYLLGGWNGTVELADFWVYDIRQQSWKLLQKDTSLYGGPSARSCHKITLDVINKKIYIIGRYTDLTRNTVLDQLHSDFYVYSIRTQTWELLSKNTEAENGPPLVYDHQLCVDPEQQIIYMFGGKVIAVGESGYSGLYSYHIPTKTWKLLRANNQIVKHGCALKSRIGHSMCFYAPDNQLFIFAGQRNRDYLSDFLIYNIDNDTVEQISMDMSQSNGPGPSFTLRANVDPLTQEIFVFSGRELDYKLSENSVHNSFWSYDMICKQWHKVYHNNNDDATYWEEMKTIEPPPRFAHQICYDHINKVHYLFGGNPGEVNNRCARLGDFWKLTLHKPAVKDLLNQILFLVRKQKYVELCSTNHIEALKFLQNQVADVTNHDDPKLSLQFRKLASFLCQPREVNEVFEQRSELLEKLFKFYPKSMKQPDASLVELIL